jgi:hypothetical protein
VGKNEGETNGRKREWALLDAAAAGLQLRRVSDGCPAIFMSLPPPPDGQPWYEVDIWHLLRQRERSRRATAPNEAMVS